jgi:Zn-dependent protease with chaperone function
MADQKVFLKGLKSEHFRHPLDQQATRSLKQIPALDIAIRALLGPVADRFFYLENIASGILVGDRQLPDIHKLLIEACEVLDIEPPQLYVRQHPAPNAYTLAIRGKQPFVVVHTSLIDLLTPEEIQAVIAHELGHLKCEHGVYLTLANLIVLAAGQFAPIGTLLAQSLQTQILEWVRCAEFTCDRAALLVAQDPRIVASVLMKLTGGSPALASRLNLDAFLEQAHSYDTMTTDELGQLLKEAQTSQLSHPLPVLRAREIDRWSNSQTYSDLLECRLMRYDDRATKGGWRNW